MGILKWPKKKIAEMESMNWKEATLWGCVIGLYLITVIICMIVLLPIVYIYSKINEQI